MEFTKPTNFDGIKFTEFLTAQGLSNVEFYDNGEGLLIVDLADSEKSKVEAALKDAAK